MASNSMPYFPEFEAYSDNASARWKRWLSRFKNMMVAMNVLLLLLMSCSTHSTCGVLCTVLFGGVCAAISGCYCKILEVKIEIGGGKSSTRDLNYDLSYLIFGDSGSKSVDTGAVN